MVQGGLLTAHPVSAHGGGEAPGGRSSLRRPPGAAGVGPHPLAVWEGVDPLRLSFGYLEASVTLIFYIFFLEFFGHCKYGSKPAIHRHQQPETGTGCTELVS